MKYLTLTKAYYHNDNSYSQLYKSRFNAPFTRHFNIDIQEYNHILSYPAFLCYTEELISLIEIIYKKYEQFLYVVNTVPPVVLHQFALVCILDEVKSTNDIEGVHSTRRQIRNILDGVAPHSDRQRSVVMKYQSLTGKTEFHFDTCEDIRSFYDDYAHEEVIAADPRNKLDGALFRKETVDVEAYPGKVIHQGLHPEEKLISTLMKSLAVLHDTEIPFLIRIALFHYFFAYIHPFYDGNGRTDRFITSYFLSRHFHYIVALRLSVLIKKKRNEYYKLFKEADSELNKADMTPFVTGFLKMIIETFDDTTALLIRKKDQLIKYEAKLDEMLPKDDLLRFIYEILLQASLFYGQGITIKSLMDITKKTRVPIQHRLNAIPKEHLLIQKINRANYYKLNMLMFK